MLTSEMPWWGVVFLTILGGAAGALTPRLIGAIPEPDPDPEADPQSQPAGSSEPDKILYADLAARSWLRPVGVVLCAAGVGMVAWRLGWDWRLAGWVVFVPIAVALAIIDWNTKLLPNWLVKPTYLVILPLLLFAAAFSRDASIATRALGGWLAFGGFFFLMWLIYPRGMGYGDVRLAGLLGPLLGAVGWHELVVGFYATFIIGPIGQLLMRWGGRSGGIPFGPFMVVGALMGLLFGGPIMESLGY